MSEAKQCCNCDESKALKAELLNSQLTLKIARRDLARLIARIDAALHLGEPLDPEFTEGAFTELTDESEALIPGACRERLLANGSVDATANWMASHLIARPKAERP